MLAAAAMNTAVVSSWLQRGLQIGPNLVARGEGKDGVAHRESDEVLGGLGDGLVMANRRLR